MKNIIQWFIYSSTDPSKVALTVRGLLVGAIPAIIFFTGLTHVNLGADDLSTVFDAVATIVQAVLAAVSGIMVIYGFVRKIWLSFKA